jgi:GntR family transcriptional regulator / MocR family aminotransferase
MKRLSSTFSPPISIDSGDKRPIYRQLNDWFRAAIAEGRMRPGQRLPSTRGLAAELQVSRISVFNAYGQLQSEGYLETFAGSGTCVARAIPDDVFRPAVLLRRAPQRLKRESIAPKVSRRGEALSKQSLEPWLHSLGPFRVGLTALDHFPINLWSKLVARHSREQPRTIMAYGDALGFLPFREAIAAYLGTFREVRCEASQILVTSGSQQALQISAQALLDTGDQLLMEEPGYPGARLAFASAGLQLLPVPVDDHGLVTAKVKGRRQAGRAAYVTPSHQYPLGVTMSAARRMSLLKWAMDTGSWIIEDDYDSEYRFDRRPIASLQGLDMHSRVIYIGTFSKVLFPALRLGYMVVPKDLVPVFAAVRDALDVFSPTLYQAVLADFIREGHFARHIRRMRMLYMERRKTLVNSIRNHMSGLVEVIGDESGMHLVALLPPNADDILVSKEASQNGISVMPLSFCYINPPNRSGLILGYGGVSPRQIRDATLKLATIVKRCIRS